MSDCSWSRPDGSAQKTRAKCRFFFFFFAFGAATAHLTRAGRRTARPGSLGLEFLSAAPCERTCQVSRERLDWVSAPERASPLADPHELLFLCRRCRLARDASACSCLRAWLPWRAMNKAGAGVPCVREPTRTVVLFAQTGRLAARLRSETKGGAEGDECTKKNGSGEGPPYQKAISALEIAVDARQERKLCQCRPAGCCFLRTPTVIFPLLRPIPALFRPASALYIAGLFRAIPRARRVFAFLFSRSV